MENQIISEIYYMQTSLKPEPAVNQHRKKKKDEKAKKKKKDFVLQNTKR